MSEYSERDRSVVVPIPSEIVNDTSPQKTFIGLTFGNTAPSET